MLGHFRYLLLLAGVTLGTGCVSPGYEYGRHLRTANDYSLPQGEIQIERGEPNKLIDGVGWVVGIPGKIILWNRRIDNHHISPQTESALAEYLAKNELQHVKVRLNQYDPIREWRRLTKNKQVGAGWRYTLGAISTLGYTVLPGRIFGGDNYNPFTNTINIYSDHTAVALHEAGHAKDFGEHTWKGSYAFAYLVPFVGLHHEAVATNDALSYLASEEKLPELEEAYKVLYPAYGTHVAGQVNHFVPSPASWVVTAACVIPGHIAGRVQAARVDALTSRDLERSQVQSDREGPVQQLLSDGMPAPLANAQED